MVAKLVRGVTYDNSEDEKKKGVTMDFSPYIVADQMTAVSEPP